MYDIYTPLVDEKIEVTIDEAKEHVLEGLKPLGEEYNSILQKAYNERWIDWLETKRETKWSLFIWKLLDTTVYFDELE